MIEAILSSLSEVVQPTAIIMLLVGNIIGLLFGALPGLGGSIAMALLIPITIGMSPHAAMVLLVSIMGGVPVGGSISAILLNVPGTPVNAATCFDGFALTRQGQAGRAIGISASASGLGAMVGLVVLILTIPLARRFIFAFTPPEFFMLTIFGLTTIAAVSSNNMLKGLIAAGVGLMIAFVGFDPITGINRFSLGISYLWDGFVLIPFLIGIFAIAEIINYAIEGGRIASVQTYEQRWKDVFQGALSIFHHKICFLRSSIIGTIIGAIPGVGGAVANFLAYSAAIQASPTPEKFGQGAVEGIIAPEAANNSKDGGALIPTIAFGIPGSVETAVLLGGLLFHGLVPGPLMFRENMDLIWTLIFTLVFSNMLASILAILFANVLTRLTLIKVHWIIPVITCLSLIGAYGVRQSPGDVLVAVIFGLVGYGMIRFKYPRVSIVIALVLGKLAERSFQQTLQISDGSYLPFFTRPISLILLLLTLFSLIFPFVKKRKAAR
jgi:putative tricarboxylic transport membrane protein